jgi:hypothetical protein
MGDAVKTRLRVPRNEREAAQMVNAVMAIDTRPESGIPWVERRLILIIRHTIATNWPDLIDEPGATR